MKMNRSSGTAHTDLDRAATVLFLERFALPVLATVLISIAVVNPLKLGLLDRFGLGFVAIGLACLAVGIWARLKNGSSDVQAAPASEQQSLAKVASVPATRSIDPQPSPNETLLPNADRSFPELGRWSPGANVYAIAVAGGRQTAYVGMSPSDRILAVPLNGSGAARKVSAGPGLHFCPAILPDENTLLVSGNLSLIRLPSEELDDVRPIATYQLLPVNGGRRVYASDPANSTLNALDMTTFAAAPVRGAVAGGTVGLALTPDGRLVILANQSGDIAFIDPTNDRVLKTLNVGGQLEHCAVAPDGKRAYVSSVDPARIHMLDLQTMEVVGTKSLPRALGRMAFGLGVSADSKSLFVSVGGISFVVFDALTLEPYQRVGTPSETSGELAIHENSLISSGSSDVVIRRVPVESPVRLSISTEAERKVAAGERVLIPIHATSSRGLAPKIVSSDLPSGATLRDAGDGSAILEFQTTKASVVSSPYEIDVAAIDGDTFALGSIRIAVTYSK